MKKALHCFKNIKRFRILILDGTRTKFSYICVSHRFIFSSFGIFKIKAISYYKIFAVIHKIQIIIENTLVDLIISFRKK